MALASTLVVQKTVALLSGDAGLSSTTQEIALMSGLTLPTITSQQIVAQNVSAEIVEQSSSPKYPLFQVYCERLTNSHQERFRVFSGEVGLSLKRASRKTGWKGWRTSYTVVWMQLLKHSMKTAATGAMAYFTQAGTV